MTIRRFTRLAVVLAVVSDEDLTMIMNNGLAHTAFAVDPSPKLTTTWGKIKTEG